MKENEKALREEAVFKQFEAKKKNPTHRGWYNTDKGQLYWHPNEEQWSCQSEKVSEEYPKFWYTPIFDSPKATEPQRSAEVKKWQENICVELKEVEGRIWRELVEKSFELNGHEKFVNMLDVLKSLDNITKNKTLENLILALPLRQQIEELERKLRLSEQSVLASKCIQMTQVKTIEELNTICDSERAKIERLKSVSAKIVEEKKWIDCKLGEAERQIEELTKQLESEKEATVETLDLAQQQIEELKAEIANLTTKTMVTDEAERLRIAERRISELMLTISRNMSPSNTEIEVLRNELAFIQRQNKVGFSYEESNEGIFTASFDGMRGMVVQSDSLKGVIEEMLTSLRVKFYHDNGLNSSSELTNEDIEEMFPSREFPVQPFLRPSEPVSSEAVEFAEWIEPRYFIIAPSTWNNKQDDSDETNYTTEQLYQEFKNPPQQLTNQLKEK